jgi:hypothetical protein
MMAEIDWNSGPLRLFGLHIHEVAGTWKNSLGGIELRRIIDAPTPA